MRIGLIISVLIYLSFCQLSKAQTDFTEIQTFIDSNITRNFLSSYLNDEILSTKFISRLNYSHDLNKFGLYLKNYYSSDISKLSTKLFRDFNNIMSGAKYQLNDELNLSLNYSGMFFSDDKALQFKGSSWNNAYIRGQYDGNYKGASVYTFADVGYKQEAQIGEFDRGISLLGEFKIFNLSISDNIFDGQIKMGYEDLDPRKKNLFSGRLYYNRSFSNNLASNEFDGSFLHSRKDFYFPADANTKLQYGVNNNIEMRTENSFRFFDRFDYSIAEGVNFYLTLNPLYRSIKKVNYYIPVSATISPGIYDTEKLELILSGDATLQFNLSSFDINLKASYLERDERYLLINPEKISVNFVKQKEEMEATKNNHSSLFKLSSSIFYSLSLSNRFEVTGSASILKYDTPSMENFDDRDELNLLVYVAHRYSNLKNLLLTTSVDLNLYHTVYILPEKSSNNNWNRILRFTSRSIFTPNKVWRNINTFSVLANYTVYDFEDILLTVNSYSFRQVNLKDSTILRFSDYFGADIYAELKLYERGELNWGQFSTRPVSYFEDKIINSELNFFFNKFISIHGGFRYFEQERFIFLNGEWIFDTYIKTQGPFARLTAELKENSRIDVITSFDYYDYNRKSPSTTNTSIYINVTWNF